MPTTGAPGETKTVELAIDPLYLAVYDEAKDDFKVLAGEYGLMVGGSSAELPLKKMVTLAGAELPPGAK